MNVFTHQIHADAGTNRGNVKGSQQLHHWLQRRQHILPADNDLGVVAADIVGNLSGILQVNGIFAHADGEGADGLFALPGGDGAHQRRVQTTAEEKSHLGVSHQTLAHPGDQLGADVAADGVQIILHHPVHPSNITIADELPVPVIVPGRKGQNPRGDSHQVFGLTGKNNSAIGIIAVIQRSDTDGVPGRDVGAGPGIIQDAGKFRVQHGKHIRSVLLIQGQKHFAVRLADEGVLPFQRPAELLKPIDFPVAYQDVSIQGKRLHSLRMQAHDGQTVKTKKALTCRNNTGIIRASGMGTGKAFLKGFQIGNSAAIANDGTHGTLLLLPAVIPLE